MQFTRLAYSAVLYLIVRQLRTSHIIYVHYCLSIVDALFLVLLVFSRFYFSLLVTYYVVILTYYHSVYYFSANNLLGEQERIYIVCASSDVSLEQLIYFDGSHNIIVEADHTGVLHYSQNFISADSIRKGLYIASFGSLDQCISYWQA